MPPYDHESSLCATCAEFDWATWLQDTSNKAYILHSRFASVFEGASHGCDLCAMITHKYNQIVRARIDPGEEKEKDGIQQNRSATSGVKGLNNEPRESHKSSAMIVEGGDDDDGSTVECGATGGKTGASHGKWEVTLRAHRDPIDSLQVMDLAVMLSPSDVITADGISYATLDQSAPNTLGPTRDEVIQTEGNLQMRFGISCPNVHLHDLQKWCMIRSHLASQNPLQIAHSRIKWLQDRLSECCSTSAGHELCERWPGDSMPQMPTRVIDCHKLCLVETSGSKDGERKLSAPYSILSHCWGTEPGLKTTSENYKEFCNAIELFQLPATIRDAIIFSRELGIRYIWVDSFCIIQSTQSGVPQDDADWMQELPKMHTYYQNAALTLVVESAKGDHEGFIKELRSKEKGIASDTVRSATIPVRLGTGDICCHVEDESNLHHFYVRETFWSLPTHLRHRAWTLQEIVLSPRKVHICEGDMIWGCTSIAQHDRLLPTMQQPSSQQQYPKFFDLVHNSGGPRWARWNEKMPEAIQVNGSDTESYRRRLIFERWYNWVADIQCRKLTFASDKLPAISAIASVMVIQLGYQYFAGLWMQDVARGLAWRTFGFGIPVPIWRAPTWSWASLDCRDPGPLHFFLNFEITETYQEDEFGLKLRKYPLQLGTTWMLDPPASLDVEALVLPFASWPENGSIPTPHENFWSRSSMDTLVHLQCEFDLMRAEDESQYGVDDLQDIVLMRLGTWVKEYAKRGERWRFGYALMIKVNLDGTYSRVGIAKVPDTEEWWEKGWQRTQLTLI